VNLDLVDAAAGGEVGGAGGAGAIDLRSGETDEKGQIGRAGAEGLGFRMRPRACEAKQAWGGRSRSCVRTYVDGEAGGLEAAGRWVGEQGRRDGRLPQAPRRQHRRPHVSPPFFRSEFRRVFYLFPFFGSCHFRPQGVETAADEQCRRTAADLLLGPVPVKQQALGISGAHNLSCPHKRSVGASAIIVIKIGNLNIIPATLFLLSMFK